MTKVTIVNKARQDQGSCGKCGAKIPAGDPYRHWSFRFGGRHVRCMKPECAPRPSDLTGSEYLSQLYALQERLGAVSRGDMDELRSIADDVRTLGDEQREKFDNMPEGLQQGETGQMLERRADACDNSADTIESAADDITETCELHDTLTAADTSVADKLKAIEEASCDTPERDEGEEDVAFIERTAGDLGETIDDAVSGLSIEEE